MLGDVMRKLQAPGFLVEHNAYLSLIEARFTENRDTLPRGADVSNQWVRVSSLGYFCSRADALQIRHRLMIQNQLGPETSLTFALGHAHHEMMQNMVLPAIAPEAMLGWWAFGDKSLAGYESEGRPELWSREAAAVELGCEPEALTYVEVSAQDHDIRLSGHPDLVLDWDLVPPIPGKHLPKGREIQEFKTKDPVSWHYIDPGQGGKPDEKHIMQVQAYMWLLGIDRARIIYIKKGERRPKEAFIEWVIERDELAISQIKKEVAAHWVAIMAAHVEKKVPANTKCKEFSKGQAKYCPLRYQCFGKKVHKNWTAIRPMTPEELASWLA